LLLITYPLCLKKRKLQIRGASAFARVGGLYFPTGNRELFSAIPALPATQSLKTAILNTILLNTFAVRGFMG